MQSKLVLVIIVASLILAAGTLTRGHDWGDDFASYILQAKSVWNGEMDEFVQKNSFTILESSIQIGPVAYPWGYPLILSPVYAVKGRSPLALKIPGLLFFSGFLICLYLLTKNRLPQTDSLLLISLFAFNPMFLVFLDQIISDIPFLFFSTLAMVLLTRANKYIAIESILLGAAISMAFFIRTTGILLLASFIIAEAFKLAIHRKNRELVKGILLNVGLVGGVFVVLWILYAAVFPGGSESYFTLLQEIELGSIPSRISSQFWLLSLFFGGTTLWLYIYYAFFVFFLVGLWVGKGRDSVFIIFFALWMILLSFWPFWQGPRFIFPLLPLFMYFTFEGVIFAIGRLPQQYHRLGKMVFYGCCLCIIGIFLGTSTSHAYRNMINGRQINGPYDIYSIAVYEFIKDKTSEDSVIIFFKPRAMRLMTNHDTVMVTECERISLGDYLVLSRKAENSQIPVEQIDSCNLPLDKVFDNRRFIIYEILK